MDERVTFQVSAKGRTDKGFADEQDAIRHADGLAESGDVAGEVIRVHEVTLGPSDIGAARTRLVYETRG